jgi:hypothetical protein
MLLSFGIYRRRNLGLQVQNCTRPEAGYHMLFAIGSRRLDKLISDNSPRHRRLDTHQDKATLEAAFLAAAFQATVDVRNSEAVEAVTRGWEMAA